MRAMSRLLQIHGSATSLDVDVVEHETKLRGAKKPWNHNTFWRWVLANLTFDLEAAKNISLLVAKMWEGLWVVCGRLRSDPSRASSVSLAVKWRCEFQVVDFVFNTVPGQWGWTFPLQLVWKDLLNESLSLSLFCRLLTLASLMWSSTQKCDWASLAKDFFCLCCFNRFRLVMASSWELRRRTWRRNVTRNALEPS